MTKPSAPHHGSLLVIFLTVFIDLLGFGMVLPLLPIYAKHFPVDQYGLLIGALMASFSLMQFIFAPMWGRLSDRVGRRPVLMIGLAGSVVFYTIFGLATVYKNLVWLFVSRIGAGIAGATISTAQAYIADTTTLENRTKGMALIGFAFGLGFMFGPLIGCLAVPTATSDPGPGPGYAAAGLSAVALLLACFVLPESLHPGAESATRKMLDLTALRKALSLPSVGLILVCIFMCVFSFANLETTLSLLINESSLEGESFRFNSPFQFTYREVFLTYAYIGFTLALVQGGLVRRLSGRVPEGSLAAIGAVLEIAGFGLMTRAIVSSSSALLLTALAVVVAGFAFLTPSLNSLLSRRSDPLKQGGILGVGQSVSALARIAGAGVGVPLLKLHILLPFYLAGGLMALGLILVLTAARGGKDYATEPA